MLESLKATFAEIKAMEPGSRFEQMYREHQAAERSPAARAGYLALGGILVVVGIIALPAPGPGTLVLAFAFGLIARESLWLARLLDRVEVWLRKKYERLRGKRG